MSTTTSTVTDLRLTASEWAQRCGLTAQEMNELLESMATDVVVQDTQGRWSLTVAFITEFERAFAAFELDDEGEDDREPDTQGAGLSIVGDNATLPRPARSRRGSASFSSSGVVG